MRAYFAYKTPSPALRKYGKIVAGSACRTKLAKRENRHLGRMRLKMRTKKLLKSMPNNMGARRCELISAMLLLEEQTRVVEPPVRACYVIAATLCAHAAAECILNEWMLARDAASYVKVSQENWAFMRVVEELLPKVAATGLPDILILINVANALCHPDESLDEVVNQWLANDGAQRAVAVALFLDSQFFPKNEPAVPQ